MNKGIADSKKAYKAPLATVIKISVRSLLCLSDDNGGTPRYGEEELEPDIFG